MVSDSPAAGNAASSIPDAARDAAHEAIACNIGEPGWTQMLGKSPHDLVDIALGAAAPLIAAAERERIFDLLGHEHYVIFTGDRWTVEHSVECRLSGHMATCRYHEAAAVIADEPRPELLGRWRIDGIDNEGLPSLQRAEEATDG